MTVGRRRARALVQRDVRDVAGIDRTNPLLFYAASQSVRPLIHPLSLSVQTAWGLLMVIQAPDGLSQPYTDNRDYFISAPIRVVGVRRPGDDSGAKGGRGVRRKLGDGDDLCCYGSIGHRVDPRPVPQEVEHRGTRPDRAAGAGHRS